MPANSAAETAREKANLYRDLGILCFMLAAGMRVVSWTLLPLIMGPNNSESNLGLPSGQETVAIAGMSTFAAYCLWQSNQYKEESHRLDAAQDNTDLDYRGPHSGR